MKYEIQYFDNGDLVCYNGYSFRKDKDTGYYLSSKPIGKRRARLHRYIWETENERKIPKGYDVHHVDGNKDNNFIGNLMLVSKQQHRFLHEIMLNDEAQRKRSENVTKNAMPKAKAWHGSEEGLAWHREHGVEAYANRKPVQYICTQCGKVFESKHIYGKNENTFCSNKCKSAHRRVMGFDNITKICECCGEGYVENKYQKSRFCKDCRDKKRGRRTSI